MQMAALMASSGYSQDSLQSSEVALVKLNATESRLLDGQQVSERDIKGFQGPYCWTLKQTKLPDALTVSRSCITHGSRTISRRIHN